MSLRGQAAVGRHDALSRQCLDWRIPTKQTLIEQVDSWEEDGNKNHTKADWQFTTAMHAPS